jgi:hypothetical protein
MRVFGTLKQLPAMDEVEMIMPNCHKNVEIG